MFLQTIKTKSLAWGEYLIYIFFAIFPFFIFKTFLYQGTSSRFLLLTLISSFLAIGLGFLFLGKNKPSVVLPKSPLLLVGGLYLVALFLSAILGADFSFSFWSRAERTSGIFYILHLIFFIFILINLFSIQKVKENILKVITFSSLIYSVATLLGPQGFNLLFKQIPYDGFLFGNSSFAAMYLLGSFFLSIYYLFLRKETSTIKKYEYFFPVFIILNPIFFNVKGGYNSLLDVIGLAQASSLSLFVGLFFLLSFFLIFKIKNIILRKKVLITFVIGSITVLIIGIVSLLSEGGMVRKFYDNQSSPARPLVWEISKESIKQKPVFGWGGDNFSLAFQDNFDVRLMSQEYGNEPWFDRAHNVVLDQTVEGGYVGVFFYFLIYGVLFYVLFYVLFRTNDKQNRILAIILFTYFFVHILELQTAFDTTISAIVFAVMFALAVFVFYDTRIKLGFSENLKIENKNLSIIGLFLVLFFTWSLIFGTLSFWRIQYLNGQIRTVGSAEKRIPLYSGLFKANVDRAGVLWRTSIDYQKGISVVPEILENPQKVDFLKQELDEITKGFEDYVLEHPETFRVRLGLADLYIYQMLFGVNRLQDAENVLTEALAISDKHPQPYWMKSVIALYQRDFQSARDNLEIAKTMNPTAIETKRLESYIENSIQTFPDLELYFFNQI